MALKMKGNKQKNFSLEKLKPDNDLPFPHYLSITQAEMYMRCAKQYEYRYIDKLKMPPAVPLVEGGCHHSAIGMNTDNYVDKEENLKNKIVVEKFSDEFSDRSVDIPKKEWKLAGDNKDSVIVRGKMMLNNYMDDIAPNLIPIEYSEKKIELMVGGIPMVGFIDFLSEDCVIDDKVVKAMKSQYEVDTDLQLTIYSEAEDKEGVAFCCLTKTKAGAVKLISSIRTSNDFKAAEMIISSIADVIKKGAFPMCSPSNSFPCSERWCGYWKKCRGKYIK